MRLDDWRNAPPETTAALYAREQERWRRHLAWDASASWSVVEEARRHNQLPGLLALEDDGRVAGWMFFLLRDGALQIGAVSSERADVVRALIDGALASPEAMLARRYQCFVFPETPAVEVALERRRFDVDRYLYLERPLAPRTTTVLDRALTWSDTQMPAAVRLMARAYAGSRGARCFAPNGRLEEWGGYLRQLIHSPACGAFSHDESLALTRDGRLAAFLLATRLSPDTAHVAQVVVDPECRRQGTAARLVDHSASVAAAGGAVRQTLLVSESNAPARALYVKLGFVERAAFLFADRFRVTRQAARPERPTSIAV